MKLPEITQEIYGDFGADHHRNTQLIEWVNLEPQWTQTAVDFARLIAPKIAELEAALQIQRKETERAWNVGASDSIRRRKEMSDLATSTYADMNECREKVAELEAEIERMRPVVEVSG